MNSEFLLKESFLVMVFDLQRIGIEDSERALGIKADF